MEHKTKVIISFDAEFSINGAFADPQGKKPASHHYFSPLPTATLGLQDVLQILQQHQVAATFFTEVLNSYYFGMAEMGQYAKTIAAQGHDIQLHAHPCWLVFQHSDWPAMVKGQSVPDTFKGMTAQEVGAILQYCVDVCAAWGLIKPTSFRAGNLFAVPVLYQALTALGFATASNVGVAIHAPDAAELRIENTTARFHDVIELPVTTFQSMGMRHKSLTITGTSFLETKNVLEQCVQHGIEYVVVLTHIHEYIKYAANGVDVRANRVNLTRLEQLCAWVNQHPQLGFTTFAALGKDPAFRHVTHQPASKIIQSAWWAGAVTILENVLNDKIWNY